MKRLMLAMVLMFGFMLVMQAQQDFVEIQSMDEAFNNFDRDTNEIDRHDYTASEVIAAYEAGQFRVINTRSVWLHMSSDGAYVSASSDGVYRVSDGMFFGQFDRATFSPDSAYVVQAGEGVYRLSDLELIVPIMSERISVNNGDHVIGTGETRFSENSEYVSVTGAGVYRLSDGQQIVETDSLGMSFSPDSAYLASSEGVFRLSDGAMLFPLVGYYPSFSPDSAYAYAWEDGLYRLSDGARLFDTPSPVEFTPDMAYAVVLGEGLYRMSDGQRLYDVDGNWVAYSPDNQYMAINEDGVYRIATGERLFAIPRDAIFSPDGLYLAVSRDGVYRLSDWQKIFDIEGDVGFSMFSDDSAFVAVSSGWLEENGGMYRISDGQNLFPIPYSANFSPDMQYAAVGTGGLYRLSDGQQMFEIEEVGTSFTSDGNYVVASSIGSDSVYRVSDGYRYQGLQLLDVSAGVMAIGNTILVVDPTQHVQNLPFIRTDSGNHSLFSEPNDTSEPLYHINGGSYLFVLDEQDGWYQVSYWGATGWIPTDRSVLFTVPE